MNTANTVIVLKTSVATRLDLVRAGRLLFPNPCIFDWHFDLDDCDKVLRIECSGLHETDIIGILHQAGFEAEKLR